MKCLIHCPASEVKWVGEYFPGTAPYLLRVANKPFLEYLIDYCVLNKINTIRITTDLADQELREQLGNGERWGIHLDCTLVPPGLSAEELLPRLAKALGNDDLLIFSGMFWLSYNQRDFTAAAVGENEARRYGRHCMLIGRNLNTGILDPEKITNCSPASISISTFASIHDFYDRTMALVKGEADHYTMPTYNNTPNVYIGQNVSIARTVTIIPPVHLGNTVQLEEHSVIGPNVVVGENSFIDQYTTLRDTIIQGESYVGSDLEITEKVVYRNMLINPESGQRLDISDDLVLMPTAAEEAANCSAAQRLMAFLLLLFQTLPFLLLRPLTELSLLETECFTTVHHSQKLRLYTRPARRWTGRWFRKFSLDRFHLLPAVLRGKLRLVGNPILPITPENHLMIQHFPSYAPGLFSYSEMLGHENDRLQTELDELYYIHHISFLLNCRILFKTLFGNLLKEK